MLADKFWSKIVMSAKGNAPNRRVAAIQAKKKRKQPKKSKTVGEGGKVGQGAKIETGQPGRLGRSRSRAAASKRSVLTSSSPLS